MRLLKYSVLLAGAIFLFQNFTTVMPGYDSRTNDLRIIPFFSCPNDGLKKNSSEIAAPCLYRYLSLYEIQAAEAHVRSPLDPPVVDKKGSIYDYSIENIYEKMIENAEENTSVMISFYEFKRPRIAKALYQKAYGTQKAVDSTVRPKINIVLVLDKRNEDILSANDFRTKLLLALQNDSSPETKAVICSDKSLGSRPNMGMGCLGADVNHNKFMLFERTSLPKNYVPKRFRLDSDLESIPLKWAVATSSQNFSRDQMTKYQNLVLFSGSFDLYDKYKSYLEAEAEDRTDLSFGDDPRHQLKMIWGIEQAGESVKTIFTPINGGDKKAMPFIDEMKNTCVEDKCRACEVLISVNNLSVDFFRFLVGDPGGRVGEKLSKKCQGNIKIVLNQKTDLLCEGGKKGCPSLPQQKAILEKSVREGLVEFKYYPNSQADELDIESKTSSQVGGVHTKNILIKTIHQDGKNLRTQYKVITGSLLPTDAHLNDNNAVVIQGDEKVYRAFKDVFEMNWTQAQYLK